MGVIRVLLVDDHAVVREGLKMLIDAQPGMRVVGEAGDGPAAIDLAERLDPDVVVVDVSMPGMTGAQVTARLLQIRPDRKVLALTVHEEAGYARLLRDAGAAGYVLKRAAASELVEAIQTVADGGTYLDPGLAAAAEGPAEPPHEPPAEVNLSDREAAVVRLIALGFSNKEIAARLGLSVKTVETYKARSMEKIGLRTRVGLVQYAAARGWLAGV